MHGEPTRRVKFGSITCTGTQLDPDYANSLCHAHLASPLYVVVAEILLINMPTV